MPSTVEKTTNDYEYLRRLKEPKVMNSRSVPAVMELGEISDDGHAAYDARASLSVRRPFVPQLISG